MSKTIRKKHILQLINEYEEKMKDYQKSIDILPFEQCKHLIYKKGELEIVIKDLKKLL